MCEPPAVRGERSLSEEATISLGQVIIIVGAVLTGLVVLAPIIGLTIGLAFTLPVASLSGWLAGWIMPGELRRNRAVPPHVALRLQGMHRRI